MSIRKSRYVFCIILLAAVLSSPQFLVGLSIGLATYANGGEIDLPSIPGFGPNPGISLLMSAPLWRDKFLFVDRWTFLPDGGVDERIREIDANTGESTSIKLPINPQQSCNPYPVGDRLLFVSVGEIYELADGVCKPLTLTFPSSEDMPQFVWDSDMPRFLWEGNLAFMGETANGFKICLLNRDDCTSIGIVKLPQVGDIWTFGDTSIRFSSPLSIRVCNSSEGFHLFVSVDGWLLHRKGFEIDRDVALKTNPVIPVEPSEVAANNPEPASALIIANTGSAPSGWSLVREKQHPGILRGGLGVPDFRKQSHEHSQGILIEGQPAALIVDDTESNDPIAHLYRFDGARWAEFASQALPFGSRLFRTQTSDDGQRSYFVVSTWTNVVYVYAIEPTGFRKSLGASHSLNGSLQILIGYALVPVNTLALGIICGAVAGILMQWFTTPDYEFGVQTVKLAALGWRGLARLIDLSAVGVSTVGIGALVAYDLDWPALVKAISFQVDHPSIRSATHTALAMIVWMTMVVVAIVVAQAYWGVTPGKWLCRLRTMRTSLRPCGISCSLAREIVFFVDCCNFLCWTSGILSIALTDRRQRLGDLIADTIVVNSSSLDSIQRTTEAEAN